MPKKLWPMVSLYVTDFHLWPLSVILSLMYTTNTKATDIKSAFVWQQIYGYEDLHMLQSRLPMVSLKPSSLHLTWSCSSGSGLNLVLCSQPSLQDYYGITFPGPTATLSSRDGGLANNPYSGRSTLGDHWPHQTSSNTSILVTSGVDYHFVVQVT